MNSQKRRFTCIPLLICSFVMMAALTVPASAEFQPVGIGTCANCGHDVDLFPNSSKCFLTRYTCSFCGFMQLDFGNAYSVSHEFVSTSVSATCTDDGFNRRECTRDGCGAVDLEIIPALGHTWEETSRTEATAVPGSIEYTCSVCGDVKYETIPAVSTDSTAGIDDLMTGFEYVVLLFGEVWELMLSNMLLTLFLAASLVVVGVKAFRRLKSAARM